MKKKELNQIKAAAFETFKSNYTPEEFRELFAGKNIISVWRVTEGIENKIIITQYDTQMNNNTLKNNGFTEEATAEKLFLADRCTKTVEFVGRF